MVRAGGEAVMERPALGTVLGFVVCISSWRRRTCLVHISLWWTISEMLTYISTIKPSWVWIDRGISSEYQNQIPYLLQQICDHDVEFKK